MNSQPPELGETAEPVLGKPAGLWFRVTAALANANRASPWRGGDFPTPERNESHSYAPVTVSIRVWSRTEGRESQETEEDKQYRQADRGLKNVSAGYVKGLAHWVF